MSDGYVGNGVVVPRQCRTYVLWVSLVPDDESKSRETIPVEISYLVVKLQTIRSLIEMELKNRKNVMYSSFKFILPRDDNTYRLIAREEEPKTRIQSIMRNLCEDASFGGHYSISIRCNGYTNTSDDENDELDVDKDGDESEDKAKTSNVPKRKSKTKTNKKKKKKKERKNTNQPYRIDKPYHVFNFVKRLTRHETEILKWIARGSEEEAEVLRILEQVGGETPLSEDDVPRGTKYITRLLVCVVNEKRDKHFGYTHRQMFKKLDAMLNEIKEFEKERHLESEGVSSNSTKEKTSSKKRGKRSGKTVVTVDYQYESTYAPTEDDVDIFKDVCRRYKRMQKEKKKRKRDESGDVQQDPYVGRRVLKDFDGTLYGGTVHSRDIDVDTGDVMYLVQYDDGDSEDLSEEDLKKILIRGEKNKKRKTHQWTRKFRRWHTGVKRSYGGYRVDFKKKYIGTYSNQIEAAKVWDMHARETYGSKNALLNFPYPNEDCKYHGVYAYDGAKHNCATSKLKWRARVKIKRLNGEKGFNDKYTYHVTKIEAAKSHDALVMKYYNEGRYPVKSTGKVEKLKLNFPDDYSDLIID